jgi:hypothetical protein
LQNAVIARGILGIEESKTDFVVSVIHGACDHLMFRWKCSYVVPRDVLSPPVHNMRVQSPFGGNATCRTMSSRSSDGSVTPQPTSKGPHGSQLHPIVVINPSIMDVPVSESVMRQHPLLKRINPNTGTSAGMDRCCWVCLNGLNPEQPNPIRKRCYTFCGGCSSSALVQGPRGNSKKTSRVAPRIYVHNYCYFYLPQHKGFTRMFTEKDGVTDFELKALEFEDLAGELQKQLDTVSRPEVSGLGLRMVEANSNDLPCLG